MAWQRSTAALVVYVSAHTIGGCLLSVLVSAALLFAYTPESSRDLGIRSAERLAPPYSRYVWSYQADRTAGVEVRKAITIAKYASGNESIIKRLPASELSKRVKMSLPLDPSYCGVCLHRVGWPLPMLEGYLQYGFAPGKSHVPRRLQVTDAILWSRGAFLTGEKLVPLRPVLPGFLANALALAPMSMALGWATRKGSCALRAGFRRRRGLCAKCGYSRRGLDRNETCPECGIPQ